eukprot:1092705-Rhodomonas_salina.1
MLSPSPSPSSLPSTATTTSSASSPSAGLVVRHFVLLRVLRLGGMRRKQGGCCREGRDFVGRNGEGWREVRDVGGRGVQDLLAGQKGSGGQGRLGRWEVASGRHRNVGQSVRAFVGRKGQGWKDSKEERWERRAGLAVG